MKPTEEHKITMLIPSIFKFIKNWASLKELQNSNFKDNLYVVIQNVYITLHLLLILLEN